MKIDHLGPKRSVANPDIGSATSVTSDDGSNISPDCSGLSPRSTCRYWGTRNSAPNKANVIAIVIKNALLQFQLLYRLKSRRGSLVRSSTMISAIRQIRPKAPNPSTVPDVHPSLAASPTP